MAAARLLLASSSPLIATERHETPRIATDRLSLPQLSGGRGLFVNMLALPVGYRWLALLPAVFLATLFFLDQV